VQTGPQGTGSRFYLADYPGQLSIITGSPCHLRKQFFELIHPSISGFFTRGNSILVCSPADLGREHFISRSAPGHDLPEYRRSYSAAVNTTLLGSSIRHEREARLLIGANAGQITSDSGLRNRRPTALCRSGSANLINRAHGRSRPPRIQQARSCQHLLCLTSSGMICSPLALIDLSIDSAACGRHG